MCKPDILNCRRAYLWACFLLNRRRGRGGGRGGRRGGEGGTRRGREGEGGRGRENSRRHSVLFPGGDVFKWGKGVISIIVLLILSLE